MDDDQLDTITQNDDELIDHVLLKKVESTSTASSGPKDYKKKTHSRRFSN